MLYKKDGVLCIHFANTGNPSAFVQDYDLAGKCVLSWPAKKHAVQSGVCVGEAIPDRQDQSIIGVYIPLEISVYSQARQIYRIGNELYFHVLNSRDPEADIFRKHYRDAVVSQPLGRELTGSGNSMSEMIWRDYKGIYVPCGQAPAYPLPVGCYESAAISLD